MRKVQISFVKNVSQKTPLLSGGPAISAAGFVAAQILLDRSLVLIVSGLSCLVTSRAGHIDNTLLGRGQQVDIMSGRKPIYSPTFLFV